MIYLLRHGETEFNREGRYQGAADSPLTERGQGQSLTCGRILQRHLDGRLPPLWCSPQPRAQVTAGLVARALPPLDLRLDPRLREISMGVWDGLTRAEIESGWPGTRKAHPPRQWMFHAPGGERLEQVLERLRSLLADAGRLPDVILVGHGVTGRLLRGLHRNLPLPEALLLDAAQNAVFALGPDGSETRLD